MGWGPIQRCVRGSYSEVCLHVSVGPSYSEVCLHVSVGSGVCLHGG